MSSESLRRRDLKHSAAAVDVPRLPNAVEDGWGSDRVARLLRAFDIPYICLNPGASYRGLHDSLVNLLGNENPQMLLCLHEESAVAIAHGYAKVTGKPLAVALHSNVGLMHATMAIFNAWCDRVPMLMLGATGPVDAVRRRPWIDWIHTFRDQASMIRPYTKWDDQPASIAATEESLLRAMRTTVTAPCGPVYVVLDAGLQEGAFQTSAPVPDVARFRPIPAPAPDPALIAEAAKRLAAAKSPAILMGRVSRDPKAWEARVKLAEQLGAAVLTDLKAGAAFPTDHPLHAGPPAMNPRPEVVERLKTADVVLSLDWIELAGALAAAWPGGTCPATVIQASLDHQLHNGASMDHMALPPVDLYLAAEPDTVVKLVSAALPPAKKQYEIPKRARVAPSTSGAITIAGLAAAFDEAIEGQSVTLVRVPLGWDGSYWHFRHPLDYLGCDGGGGLAAGPGMVVGAALALKGTDRLPVAILGDGDTLMGITAFWTAVHYRVPLLAIVSNNRSYFNDELHQERMARMRSRPVENRWVGQRIADPEPDIAMMARAQGAVGIGPVRDAAELQGALTEAVAAVRAGAVVVVDVHVLPGYAPSMTSAMTRLVDGKQA
jgi:thiamine pyrophosphate-dependent acetolactate synthase large subunit-like protein